MKLYRHHRISVSTKYKKKESLASQRGFVISVELSTFVVTNFLNYDKYTAFR